jgi:ATP-binding cassette, subfamily B, multidrug efflux pump
MEEEKVLSGYNPRVMRRLMAYAKPYWPLVIAAIVSLAIGTLGDLLLPIVIQRAVDDNLIARFTRIPAEFVADLDNVDMDDAVTLPAATYVPDDKLVALSGVDRSRLTEIGAIEELGYYVFVYDDDLIAAFDGEFESFVTETGIMDGRRYASIEAARLDDLSEEQRRLVRAEDLSELRRTTMVFLVLLASVLGFTFTQIYFMALVGQGVMKDMRMELFSHTIRQRLGHLSGHPVGRLVTRVTNDVETVNQFFTEVLINLLRNLALMVGSVATIMLLNWRLGLVTVATLPPVLLLTVFFRTRARDAYRKLRMWVSRVNAFLSEHLSGMSVVQLFVRERKVWSEFSEKNDELMKANLGEMYVFATFRPIIDLLSSVSIAVVIYFGANFLVSGVVSLGVLIAFVNLIRRFYQPVMSISEQFTVLQSALAGSERVFEMIDEVDRIPDEGTRDSQAPVAGSVEFDHVWFEYKEGEPVIRDLSFKINPGETIAIVGYTGAGKTTIANLLTRMWDIQKGRILLDGVDIREYPLDTLRTVIQPIQQDVFLFSDTVGANIRLGRDIPDEELHHIASLVQAGFIDHLPEGYETVLTEGATNISTGERQLLSFARVLAHDPRIIIMDEATANIDTETEQLIQKAVGTIMETRTSLVIAHRLSTIKHADRILVLAQGELVEQGTHDTLIAEKGIYYNLYKLQYQENDVT